VRRRILSCAGALACAAVLASCEKADRAPRGSENGARTSAESGRQAPLAYDLENHIPPATADELKRAIYVAGLSMAVPPDGRLLYPQGIDSAAMMISGPGYQLNFDDYGAFQGPATAKLGGAPATLTEKRNGSCRFRHWEVKLPKVAETMRVCDRSGSDCYGPPAHANISTYCMGARACEKVDTIVSSARFAKAPWSRMPLPDPRAIPEAPPCRVIQ